MDEGVEVYGELRHDGLMVVTCEHATRRVPPPLVATAADERLLDAHWGWDPGAEWVPRRLVDLTSSVGIFSRFSRLVCDPNRDPSDPTWILTQAEGHCLSFNQELDEGERERRRSTYHDPYHQRIDEMLSARLRLSGDVLLLSVHSFTPVLGDEVRSMELGVIFDAHEAVAARFAKRLKAEGFVVALNEPYSGYKNVMYSANRHGNEHRVLYLELEIRQDLLGSEEAAKAVAESVYRALKGLGVRKQRRARRAI
ncbi:MAG: hypothetical protein COW42_02915 [Deltaproteobacteria bacterium CG17_big_fil_post_rev_8_21_14_2_50_63_7]|nr:MAG: hypothetical protein COW42_02915 [Deltaproteobacteria bacterium CG17_big_fil_post_rev_8_21_14_2_50_63_7]